MRPSLRPSALPALTLLTLPLHAAPNDPLVEPAGGAQSLHALRSGFVLSSATFDGAHESCESVRHAPIGVMGDHVHGAGEWMLSLRYMRMNMEPNRSGTTDLTPEQVLAQGYMVTPLEMTMDMWMLGGMYAPTDGLTLMLMVPYVTKSMSHRTGGGVEFETETSGFGDLGVSALVPFWQEGVHRAHANLGLSVPTGSVTERGATPMSSDAKLPYPMQLGSGTWDLVPGVTYAGQRDRWAWGAQVSYRLRTGENSEDYRLGDVFDATAWGDVRVAGDFGASLRLDYSDWDDVHGADPELNPMMVPTADPELRGGQRLDLLFGADWAPHAGAAAGQRLALEFGLPVYQDLDGPQLATDWVATIGWQAAF